MNLKKTLRAASVATTITAGAALAVACTPVNCHTDHGASFGYVACDAGDYKAVVDYWNPLTGNYGQAFGPHMANGSHSFAYVPSNVSAAGGYVTSVSYIEA